MTKLKETKLVSLTYVDDLVIVGYDKKRLELAISIVEEWADRNKIIINKKKSGVMIHSSRNKPCKKDTGEIRGYPYKNEYKYLGIIIDKNLTLKK